MSGQFEHLDGGRRHSRTSSLASETIANKFLCVFVTGHHTLERSSCVIFTIPGELCPVSVSAGLGALRCECHVRADWSK